MPIYERGDVRIHYEESGAGFPMLILPGGGLNSTLGFFTGSAPFNPMVEYAGEYRCIAADLRNANGGQSSGPVEVDRPWDSYADDQLGLMDHLGIDKFMVMGFCIGGPFIWNLLRRAPDRIVAAVLAQPSGFRPEMPDLFYNNNITGWGPPLCARRPDVSMETIDAFLNKMYRNPPISCSPWTAISCATARHPFWCCRTTCRRILTRWRWNQRCCPRTRRSAFIRGRNRKSGFPSRSGMYGASCGPIARARSAVVAAAGGYQPPRRV